MTKPLAAYGTLLVVLVGLDALWLGLLAQPLYRQGIAQLLADQPRLGAAALFYLVYALGLLLFVVQPHAAASAARHALWAAAFGFVAYATYDLTNLATLKDWPAWLSVLDMAWGCVASVLAASAARAVLQRLRTT